MPINLGSEQIQGVFLGTTPVSKAYLGDVLIYGADVETSVSISGTLLVGETLSAVVLGVDSVTSYLWERVYEDYSEFGYDTPSITLQAIDQYYYIRLTVEAVIDGVTTSLSVTTTEMVDRTEGVLIQLTPPYLQSDLYDLVGLKRFIQSTWEKSSDGLAGWTIVQTDGEGIFSQYLLSGPSAYFRLTLDYLDQADTSKTAISPVFGPV